MNFTPAKLLHEHFEVTVTSTRRQTNPLYTQIIRKREQGQFSNKVLNNPSSKSVAIEKRKNLTMSYNYERGVITDLMSQ